jgi:two-component system NarL family sensor kinase
MLEKTGLYTTSFVVTGPEQRLESSREIILYRIIQEALNNMIRHAGATSVSITMNFTAAHLQISINDNGKGFDPSTINNEGMPGLGLRNMAKRARLIEAGFNIRSQAGKGTSIVLHVPFLKEPSLVNHKTYGEDQTGHS